jgi:hypothetical protein
MIATKYKIGDIFEYKDEEKYDEEQYYLVINVGKQKGYALAGYQILCLNTSTYHYMWQTSLKEENSKWVA